MTVKCPFLVMPDAAENLLFGLDILRQFDATLTCTGIEARSGNRPRQPSARRQRQKRIRLQVLPRASMHNMDNEPDKSNKSRERFRQRLNAARARGRRIIFLGDDDTPSGSRGQYRPTSYSTHSASPKSPPAPSTSRRGFGSTASSNDDFTPPSSPEGTITPPPPPLHPIPSSSSSSTAMGNLLEPDDIEMILQDIGEEMVTECCQGLFSPESPTQHPPLEDSPPPASLSPSSPSSPSMISFSSAITISSDDTYAHNGSRPSPPPPKKEGTVTTKVPTVVFAHNIIQHRLVTSNFRFKYHIYPP